MTSWVETGKPLTFFYSVQRKGGGKYEGDGTSKFIERKQKVEDEYERDRLRQYRSGRVGAQEKYFYQVLFCQLPLKKFTPRTFLVQYAKFRRKTNIFAIPTHPHIQQDGMVNKQSHENHTLLRAL